jgi:serine protease SohB
MHYLAEYGLFLAKILTALIATFVVIIGIMVLSSKGKLKSKEKLEITKLNDKYKDMKQLLNAAILTKAQLKQLIESEKQAEKQQKKTLVERKKIYVIQFKGDIKASAVKQLREEITGILLVANSTDEVVIQLESHGGMVHSYGLAASELVRLRQHRIPLTIIIDKIAASGGYLMASVATHIIAAPFAIVGSIGVIAQLPNFNRLLKKHDIDYEQITAGEYKRTMTMFGENTEKGRKKFKEEIEDVHELFKKFVVEYRPQLNIDKVATGEHWYGSHALALNLVDELMTSDDYLLKAKDSSDIYQVTYTCKKTLADKISLTAQASFDKLLQTWHRQNEINL